MIQSLTPQDKRKIQDVTRYSDSAWAHRYEFNIVYGSRILLSRPGTTSRAYFRSESDRLEDIEMYVAKLAVFALKRLYKKHGDNAFHMLNRDVLVVHDKMNGTNHLWELIEVNTGHTRESLKEEVAKR